MLKKINDIKDVCINLLHSLYVMQSQKNSNLCNLGYKNTSIVPPPPRFVAHCETKSKDFKKVENPSNLPVIPIMHCFDENYCLPAAVSFYSMLEHANPNYFYKLYVLHSNNISYEQQEKLQQTIQSFCNASLTFINKGQTYDAIWEKINKNNHFSKEIFYKLSVASSFPEYDKMIVTDVDVVWAGDISEQFFMLNSDEDFYLGIYETPKLFNHIGSMQKAYDKCWSKQEQEKLCVSAGFVVYNLKKIREDDIERQFLAFLESNAERLILPEQDVLGSVCYPKTKILSKNGMISTYVWDIFDSDEKLDKATWIRKDLEYALTHPVQIHFTGPDKPWKVYNVLKADIWFQTLVKTNYLSTWLQEISSYKEFYTHNKDKDMYPYVKPIIALSPFISLSKRRGLIKICCLNVTVYFDFTSLHKLCKKFYRKNEV